MEDREKGAEERSWWREAAEIVVIAILLSLVVRAVLFETFIVEGHSMMDTLVDGERVLVNKLIYRLSSPQRGDIIVFRCPERTRDFVKRVIATPGEVVEIRDGGVLVNGRALEEGYLTRRDRASFPAVKVPARSLFVMGDNRGNSEDSRHFGFVPYENVRGRVMLVFWPPSRARVELGGDEPGAPFPDHGIRSAAGFRRWRTPLPVAGAADGVAARMPAAAIPPSE